MATRRFNFSRAPPGIDGPSGQSDPLLKILCPAGGGEHGGGVQEDHIPAGTGTALEDRPGDLGVCALVRRR